MIRETWLFGILSLFFLVIVSVLGTHAWLIWDNRERVAILETLVSFEDRIEKLEEKCRF